MAAFATAYVITRPPLTVRHAELPVLVLIGLLIRSSGMPRSAATWRGA